ncbi:MAG TPA: FecR domain-containing protein, partial [Labilithrix sp.]|nr:FecR domain-containing protein [Labilithrix sp.]
VGLGRGAPTEKPTATAVDALAKPTPAAAASFVRGSPVVVRKGARAALSSGAALEPGDRVVVESGSRLSVVLTNGTYLVVDDHAELVLSSAPPVTTFELGSGSVHADVAKLLPNERFVIHTADAEVEVHGTSFDVSRVEPDPACGNGTSTRVKVREGVVAVRARGIETLVRANETWPSGCGTTANAPPNEIPTASTTTSGHGGIAAPIPPKRTVEASTLAAQNDLFEKALARKRAGDTAGAIAGFEELLSRFPSSHLAQAARGERMKLLRGVDKARAKDAARDYLHRYPTGFARADAELMLAGD